MIAAFELARAARTEAKQAAKILAQRQREQRKAEEQMAKNSRRWKREAEQRKRNDQLVAQCGINWTTMREAHS